MAIGDEPLSLQSNLLVLHWLCGFRNSHLVRHRRLPFRYAQRLQTKTVSTPYQQAANKQNFSYEFSLRPPPHPNESKTRAGNSATVCVTMGEMNPPLKRGTFVPN
jgi:hypothetical protein